MPIKSVTGDPVPQGGPTSRPAPLASLASNAAMGNDECTARLRSTR